ncbi:MAG TPA: GAF domain-containing protein [Candidatus Acidoferrales bacterium]|nr:GAF domain-containing protein [Candidatus Acidoferrales bacterium]
MNGATVRELARALDTDELREVRAQRAAEIVRAAGGYRWVGIYEVDDDRVSMLGHTGPTAAVHATFDASEGLTGEAVRTRASVAGTANGSEAVIPILGAESGIVIGTLDVESDRAGAFGEQDREFLETCAAALMPLFE